MKAIILARVSTKEQEEGHSLNAQKMRLEDYCRRRELEILRHFEIIESSTRGERKEFMAMLEFAKRQPTTVAIVADAVDRVQRSFRESVMLDDLRRQKKIEMHFIREGKIIGEHASAMDIMCWDFAVMGAKSYVLQLSENVKRSYEWKLKNGELPSQAPLGYLNIRTPAGKADVVIDPERAPVVQKLFELYATGGYSIEGLAAYARQQGLRNKGGRGTALVKSHIHKLLRNPFYYGLILRKGTAYEHRYERLISKELFDQCERVRNGYAAKPATYCQNESLFRGLVQCGVSGKVASPDSKEKTFSTGRHAVYNYLVVHNPEAPAKRLYVKEDEVIAQLTEVLRSLRMPDVIYQDIKVSLQASTDAERRYHEDALKGLQHEEIDLQRQLDRLLDLLIADRVSIEDHDRKQVQIKNRQLEVRNQINHHHHADDKFRRTLTNLLLMAQRAGELFERGNISEKRDLLLFVFTNLTLTGNKLRYSLHLPFDKFQKASDRKLWSELVDDLRTDRSWFATFPIHQLEVMAA